MSFMVVNALSYALQTVYHDIDTTTLVLDVLVFFLYLKLIYRKTSRHPEKCSNLSVYIYIYIPE